MIEIKSMSISPSPKPFVYEKYDEQCMKSETFDIRIELFDNAKMVHGHFIWRLEESITKRIQQRLNEIKEPNL